MRIVHICLTGTFTDNRNYQENVLSKYHAKLGHEVYVVASKWIQSDTGGSHILDERDSYVDEYGVHVIRLNMKGREYTYKKFKRFCNLYGTLEDINPDFLFIHGVASLENTTIVTYLKKHPEVRARADNHADFSNSATSLISRKILHGVIWRHYARLLNPYIEKFYGVLPARVDFLVDIYGLPKNKCELLVMGADDEMVEKARSSTRLRDIREEYGIEDDDFLIVTGGKIDSAKKQTLLLMEAVKRISNSKLKLLVFGSIQEDLREQFDSLLVENRIMYSGWIDSNNTYYYFGIADLVVFPGRHSVFWEQVVGQGIPMICKYWEGTQHVDVGGNVLFISSDTVDEITSKIQYIIQNEDAYNEMKRIAITKGMGLFSYRNISLRCLS